MQDGAGTRIAVARQVTATPENLTDRYRLDQLLGAGGMGAVWRATDRTLKRAVAVKLVSVTDPMARTRFGREARLTSSLEHPGIVQVFDVGEVGATCFLVMELLAGETLAAQIARAPIALGEILRVVADVAETMAFAHGRGLVHRDLKPENIFLHRTPASTRTVVIDFGLGFALEGDAEIGRVTLGDIIAGTPAYMSPEQARGQSLGPASDVYSLGNILYELLHGETPFTGPPAVLLSQHAYAPPPRLRDSWRDAPAALDDLIEGMLSKSPVTRPTMAKVAATCRALAAQLREGDDSATIRERSAVAVVPRSARAISRVEPQAFELDRVSATVLAVGDLDDAALLALAASGLAAVRGDIGDIDGCDVVIAAVPAGRLAELVARGRPVIALHDGTIEHVLALVRVGVADAAPAGGDAAILARKARRAVRWQPAAQPVRTAR